MFVTISSGRGSEESSEGPESYTCVVRVSADSSSLYFEIRFIVDATQALLPLVKPVFD